MIMNTLYDVPAPAKINLFLHINGYRSDGYHFLQTVFRFINLNDILNFELRSDGIISFEQFNNSNKIKSNNLILSAARILKKVTGTYKGVHISLKKYIPLGSGLGGGSSDAASTLIALNRLWETNLSRKNLMSLALKLGADVPVFIFGQSAFAEGIGELLSKICLPDKAYLIICPNIRILTSKIFLDFNLTRNSKLMKIKDFSSVLDSSFGKNDFETVIYESYPEILEISKLLKYENIQTRISGSGSSLYAEYENLSEAILAEQKITAIIRNGFKNIHKSCIELSLIKGCLGLNEHPLVNWIR
ncbi:MAG: 4-(cytidine 5'-diphospho)-2-C-methyl-D-erythritol kinase [Bordetella sp.]|nr:MAG: 4-(cytidine 5'-diphospho)-2-C-methyl-D-erythritol kinase [Bordetella sp.]